MTIVTYTGSRSTVLTLAAAAPDVRLAGTVSALGSVTQYIIRYHNRPTAETVEAAVYAPSGTAFTIENDGTVTMAAHRAFDVGVVLREPGFLDNTGAILGGSGIALLGAPVPGQDTTIENEGLVRGALYDAILLAHGGTVENAGSIAGLYNGIAMAGLAGTVTNTGSGAIAGTEGAGILLGAGGSVLNAGFVLGAYAGVSVAAGGVVHNSGTVETTGPNGVAIAVGGGGSIGNGGLALGATAISLYAGAGAGAGGTLINAGAATGTAAAGIVLRGGAAFTNTGMVSGAEDGVLIDPADAAGITFTATNAAGGTIAGLGRYGLSEGEAGTFANSGAVEGLLTGVTLKALGATLVNVGLIEAMGTAVISGGATIEPTGVGVGAAGIGLYNGAGGTIAGLVGISSGSAGTIVNDGLIEGSAANAPVVMLGPAATLVEAGTILATGSAAAAVRFVPGAADRLVIKPGAVMVGSVDGGIGAGGGFSTVLELAAGGEAGAIGGIGSDIADFSEVLVDPGAAWLLTGTNTLGAQAWLVDDGEIVVGAGASLGVGGSLGADIGASGAIAVEGGALSFGGAVGIAETVLLGAGAESVALGSPAAFRGTIAGFGRQDTIDLPNLAFSSGVTAALSGGIVTVATGGESLTLAIGFTDAPFIAALPDGHGGTELSAACFAGGTRLLTARGEVAVEAVRPGDGVVTFGGAVRRVVWTGARRVDCRRHKRPEAVWPVRVCAHAFAPGMPKRDLVLSPDHAVFADGVLVPVSHLVNGATIRQEQAGLIRYFHVELERHDILWAEGLPAESYLDCANRSLFGQGRPALPATGFAAPAWDAARACAPLVTAGPALSAIRRRLHRAALALGHRIEAAPPVTLASGGRPLPLLRDLPDLIQARLPAGTRKLTLWTMPATPADTDPESTDRRAMGVALAGVSLFDGGRTTRIGAMDARLAHGFYPAEQSQGRAWRWTGAEAALDAVLPPGMGEALMTLHLAGRQARWAGG